MKGLTKATPNPPPGYPKAGSKPSPEVLYAMPKPHIPQEVAHKFAEWESRQKYNPMETEQVEGNLRMTKIRRTIPITSHYFSNNNEREQPHR
jgi:hypothetical protein